MKPISRPIAHPGLPGHLRTSSPFQVPRFGAYRPAPNGEWQLFTQTHTAVKEVTGYYISPDKPGKQKKLTLTQEGDYWVSKETFPNGAACLTTVDKEGNELLLPESLMTQSINGKPFFYLPDTKHPVPQLAGPMIDIFPDSLTTPERLSDLLDRYDLGDTIEYIRNHFYQYVHSTKDFGLEHLTPLLYTLGFRQMMLHPVNGGDDISAPGYWTQNPYHFNRFFENAKNFETYLNDFLLPTGMKLFFDGAFVNQGLNGTQYHANAVYGKRSPFWDWFHYDPEANTSGLIRYPRVAFETQKIGVLPTEIDPKTGQSKVREDHRAYTVINDPLKANYDKRKPVYIQYYDPLIHTEQGQLRSAKELKGLDLSTYQDSMQRLRYQISPDALALKRHQEAKMASELDKKQLYFKHPGLELTPNFQDDSAVKWDGQLDVAKLNMRHPEVQAYLQGAMRYWNRLFYQASLRHISQALQQAAMKAPQAEPKELLKAITIQSLPDQPEELLAAIQKGKTEGRILAPIRSPEIEQPTETELQQTLDLERYQLKGNPYQHLAHTLRSEFPIASLPLPDHMMAILTHPKFESRLAHEPLWLPARIVAWLISPIVSPFRQYDWIDKLCNKVANLFRPQSFDELLIKRLEGVETKLSENAKTNLKNTLGQSAVSIALAQKLYLTLFTGQTEITEPQLEEAFYNTLPTSLLHADPETGYPLGIVFLKRRLAELKDGELLKLLEESFASLDPKQLALAHLIMDKREIGLNWRIDAAADVSNRDAIKNQQDPELRKAKFQKEMHFMKTFWRDMVSGVKTIFPKVNITAELTDLDKLLIIDESTVSDNEREDARQTAFEKINTFFAEGIFTSMPNYSFVYGNLARLFHHGVRPQEAPAGILSPQEFMDTTVKPMTTSLHPTAVQHLQNMTSNHDAMTTVHGLLTNPEIATMDALKWWGIENDLSQVEAELKSKQFMLHLRKNLASVGLETETLNKILPYIHQVANKMADRGQFSREVNGYFFKGRKEEDRKETLVPGEVSLVKRREATPLDAKRRFLDELFAKLEQYRTDPEKESPFPSEAQKASEQLTALKVAYAELMLEPSKVKALRAIISNALSEEPLWNRLKKDPKLSQEALKTLSENILSPYLSHAFAQVTQQYDEHWGQEPLEIALDRLFEALPLKQFHEQFPDTGAYCIQQFKNELYQQALLPVLTKMKQLIATQIALPGTPSIYLPDLFLQSGGEWYKNMFVQNRNVIRHDWIDPNSPHYKPFVAEFQRDVQQLLKLREKVPALSSQHLIPVAQTSDVLTFIKDNGQDEVIMMIHTGQPSNLNSSDGGWNSKVGVGSAYKHPTQQQAEKTNFKLDLTSTGFAPGKTYKNALTPSERFIINQKGYLVNIKDAQKGIDFRSQQPYVVLIRENTPIQSPLESKAASL